MANEIQTVLPSFEECHRIPRSCMEFSLQQTNNGARTAVVSLIKQLSAKLQTLL